MEEQVTGLSVARPALRRMCRRYGGIGDNMQWSRPIDGEVGVGSGAALPIGPLQHAT